MVILLTVKWRSLMFGVDPPLQLEEVVQKIWAVQFPVPSAMISGWLVNPETPPGMATFAPFSVVVMLVTVVPDPALNKKSEPPPAPVSTNLLPLFSTTSTVTFDPL